MDSLSIEFDRYYGDYLSFLETDDREERRRILAENPHIHRIDRCSRPITELMRRLNIHDMEILSVGSGEGHEEFWFARNRNRLTLLDANPEFAERLMRKAGEKTETTLDFIIADIQDYLESPRQYDICYISSLHPDEMYRRQTLQSGHTSARHSRDESAGNIWPDDQLPLLPYVPKCATLVKDDGWFIYQSYASGCSVTENPHFLDMLCRQLEEEGLYVAETWYFQFDPCYFLIVAKKASPLSAKAVEYELSARPPLTTFHGRHQSDRKYYITRLSRSDISAMAAEWHEGKNALAIFSALLKETVPAFFEIKFSEFAKFLKGVIRRLGTRRLGAGAVFQRTTAVPRTVAYRIVARLRLLVLILDTFIRPANFPHIFLSRAERRDLGATKVIVLHTFDDRHAPMVLELANKLEAQNVHILAMDSDAAAILAPNAWSCTLIRDVAMDLHAEVADHAVGYASVTSLLESIDRHCYHGVPMGDLIRLTMFQRDEHFRRIWRGLTRFWEEGADLVIIATTTLGEHTHAMMPLVQRLAALHPIAPGAAMEVEGRKDDLWLWTKRPEEDHSWVSRTPKTSILRHRLPFPISAAFDPMRDFLERRLPQVQAAWAEQGLSEQPVLVISDAWPDSVYWRGLIPVIDAIHQLGHPVLVVTMNPSARDALTAMGITTVVINHGSEIPTPDQAEALAFSISELAKLASSRNAPLQSALVESLRGDLRFLAQLADSMKYLHCMAETLIRLQPASMIVMPIWSPAAQWAEAAARQADVPTISYPTVTVSGDRWSLVDWRSDFVAAYGFQCSTAFTQIGFPVDRLVLTGNPAMDALYSIDREVSLHRLLADHEISTERRILLVATTGADNRELEWVAMLTAYCKERGDCQVIVKPHPNYSAADYGALADRSQQSWLQIIESADVRDLLAVSEICITDMSTVGAEAVLMGKPLLVANLTGDHYVANPYDEFGVALNAASIDALRDHLNTLLDSATTREDLLANRKNFADAYNHGDDGSAADRIAELAVAVAQCTNPINFLEKKANPDICKC